MNKNLNRFRTASFAFALFCFVLPFVTLSCAGFQKSFSGLETMFGTTVGDDRFDGSALGILAFSAVVVGLLASLSRTRGGALLSSCAGALAALLLFLLKIVIENRVRQESDGMTQVSAAVGLWLAGLSSGAGGVMGFFIADQQGAGLPEGAATVLAAPAHPVSDDSERFTDPASPSDSTPGSYVEPRE